MNLNHAALLVPNYPPDELTLGTGGSGGFGGTDDVEGTSTGTASAAILIGDDGYIYWSRSHIAGGAFQQMYPWIANPDHACRYRVQWDAEEGLEPDFIPSDGDLETGDPIPNVIDICPNQDPTWRENKSTVGTDEADFNIYLIPYHGGAPVASMRVLLRAIKTA